MKQTQTIGQTILMTTARMLMGRGLDKRFPRLVLWYKKIFSFSFGKGLVQVSIPLNQRLWVKRNDPGLGLMLRTKGEFEPMQTKWWIKTIKPGMTVVDVGANVGYYSVLASVVTDKVVAIEPEPRMYKLLKKNVSTKTYNLALGDKKGFVGLEADDNPGETKIIDGKKTVKMVRFTDLVDRADVVKIDVEGAEPLVLKGIKKGSVKTLVCECNPNALTDFGFTVSDLMSEIIACGMKVTNIIDERVRGIVKYSRKELNSRLEMSSYVSLIARAK